MTETTEGEGVSLSLGGVGDLFGSRAALQGEQEEI